MSRIKETFIITEPNGSVRSVTLIGRCAWSLRNLIDAGAKGCTPINTPGPRWSAYVHTLKKKHGIDIQTVTEQHSGPYNGSHARYVLKTKARKCCVSEAA